MEDRVLWGVIGQCSVLFVRMRFFWIRYPLSLLRINPQSGYGRMEGHTHLPFKQGDVIHIFLPTMTQFSHHVWNHQSSSCQHVTVTRTHYMWRNRQFFFQNTGTMCTYMWRHQPSSSQQCHTFLQQMTSQSCLSAGCAMIYVIVIYWRRQRCRLSNNVSISVFRNHRTDHWVSLSRCHFSAWKSTWWRLDHFAAVPPLFETLYDLREEERKKNNKRCHNTI